MVKRLRHHPFTVVTWVRVPLGSPMKKHTISVCFFIVPKRGKTKNPSGSRERSDALPPCVADTRWGHTISVCFFVVSNGKHEEPIGFARAKRRPATLCGRYPLESTPFRCAFSLCPSGKHEEPIGFARAKRRPATLCSRYPLRTPESSKANVSSIHSSAPLIVYHFICKTKAPITRDTLAR